MSLQVCPDIYIPRGYLVRAHKDVPTVPTCTVNADRVLARVRSCAVQRDLAALVAVGRVRGPGRLVPALLEALGDLGDGEGRKRQREESGLAEHGSCLWGEVWFDEWSEDGSSFSEAWGEAFSSACSKEIISGLFICCRAPEWFSLLWIRSALGRTIFATSIWNFGSGNLGSRI